MQEMQEMQENVGGHGFALLKNPPSDLQLAALLKGEFLEQSVVLKGRPPEIYIDGAPLYVGKPHLVEATQSDSMKRQWHINVCVNPFLLEKEDWEEKLNEWFYGLQPVDGEEVRNAKAAYHKMSGRHYSTLAVITIEKDHLRFYSPIQLDLVIRKADDDFTVRFDALNNPPFYCEVELEKPSGMYIIDGKALLH